MTNSNKKSGLADSPLFRPETEEKDPSQKQVTEGLSRRDEHQSKSTPKDTRQTTSESTQIITHVRDSSREIPRNKSREVDNQYPRRDEIQVFNFQLRDALKVKVQAEVPHEWQQELQEVAHELGIKKMELYRFIYGEFLGKVKRKE